MRTIAAIVRNATVIVTWFVVTVACAATFTMALADLYLAMELTPVMATLSTLVLAMLAGTAAGALCWFAIERSFAWCRARLNAAGDRRAAAAFVNIA